MRKVLAIVALAFAICGCSEEVCHGIPGIGHFDPQCQPPQMSQTPVPATP
jgi:hypothetical protein